MNYRDLIEKGTAVTKDFQDEASAIQLTSFVVRCSGKGNPWAMFKQAQRETRVRTKILTGIQLDLQDVGLDIEETQTSEEGTQARRSLILARKYLLQGELESKAESVSRELTIVLGCVRDLQIQLGELSQEDKDELEAQSWAHRTAVQFVMDLYDRGRPSSATIEMLHSLPQDLKADVLGVLARDGTRWFESGAPELREYNANNPRIDKIAGNRVPDELRSPVLEDPALTVP